MFDHEVKIHKYETLNGIMQRFWQRKKLKFMKKDDSTVYKS